MLKLLNKYEMLRICDNCGEEKIIQKSRYNVLLKKDNHLCFSCSRKGNWIKKYNIEKKEDFLFLDYTYFKDGKILPHPPCA